MRWIASIRPLVALRTHPAFELAKATWKEFLHDKCTHLAAGVAYYILLSVFPLFIFAVSILGLVLQDDSRRQQFIDELISQLPLDAVESVEQAPRSDGQPTAVNADGRVTTELELNMRDAINGLQGFSLLGLVGLAGTLWAASGMFAAMRNALDMAWDVEQPQRNFVLQKVTDFTMIGGIGLVFVMSIALTGAVSVARSVADLTPLGRELPLMWQGVGIAISLVTTFTALMLLYRFVPDSREPTWSTIWPGAVLAAIGWEVLKNGFSIYIANFSNYDEVYGTIGTVVVFLFWAWLLNVIVLLGAEFAAEYGRYHRRSPQNQPQAAAPR